MADNTVQLTDLEVIQRWSLAVRTATADRDEVVAALRADLAWLDGGRARSAKPVAAKKAAPRKAASRSASGRAASRR